MGQDLNISKITKLLMLTTSDNDSEALVAIRSANGILNRAKTTWSDFISSLTHRRNTQAHEQSVSIDEIFIFVLGNLRGPGPREFIESLYAQWNDTGELSPRQYDALIKFYMNQKTRNRAR